MFDYKDTLRHFLGGACLGKLTNHWYYHLKQKLTFTKSFNLQKHLLRYLKSWQLTNKMTVSKHRATKRRLLICWWTCLQLKTIRLVLKMLKNLNYHNILSRLVFIWNLYQYNIIIYINAILYNNDVLVCIILINTMYHKQG